MSPSLIFVTGATGFIGSHVVQQTLEAGHHVRLSVRKESQIAGLKALFSKHVANVEFVVIPDFSKSGAFDEPLRGVHCIFHLASPMPGTGSDFKKDYVHPAVQGTISILDAATKISTIKRVIIVSSLLALLPLDALISGMYHAKEGVNQTIPVDTDMDFPEDPIQAGGLKYHASKILSHRATLDWVSKNNPHFSVVTLHPSFVYGRNLTQTSPDGIDGTNAMLWRSLYSEKPFVPLHSVDVRDVALAHLKALDANLGEKNQVEEFIISASAADGWTWGEVTDFARKRYPTLGIKLSGPFPPPPSADTGHAEAVLGLKWKKMEDTMSDFLGQQVELRSQL